MTDFNFIRTLFFNFNANNKLNNLKISNNLLLGSSNILKNNIPVPTYIKY